MAGNYYVLTFSKISRLGRVRQQWAATGPHLVYLHAKSYLSLCESMCALSC